MSLLRTALLGGLVAVCACGGASALPTVRPPSPARPTLPTAPPRVEIVHALRAPIDLGDVAEGRLVLVGGMRLLRAPGGRFQAARDMLSEHLVGAAHVHAGWYVVAASAQVWRAADPLGELTPVATDEMAELEAAPSRDALVAVDARDGGRLRRFDGTRLAVVPTSFGVASAAFLDATHALALAGGGQLAWSGDGGSTWRSLARPERGRSVSLTEHGWQVMLAPEQELDPDVEPDPAGGLDVAADGSVSVPEEESPPTWRGAPIELTLELLQSVPAWLAADPDVGWIDGKLVAQVPSTADVILLDPVARTIERVADALPSSACRIRRWGPRVAALCPGEEDEEQLRWDDADDADDAHDDDDDEDDGAGDEESPSAISARVLASSDGRTFVDAGLQADMGAALGGDGQTAAWGELAMRASGATETTTFDEAEHRALAVSGSVCAGTGRDGLPWVGDAHIGAVRAIELADDEIDRRVPLDGAVELLSGGTQILWTARSSMQEFVAFRGPIEGPLRRLRLPPSTEGVSFVDESRGLAVGHSTANAWRTHDGGTTWESVTVAAPDAADAFRRVASVRCFPERCIVRGASVLDAPAAWMVVWGWDRPRPSNVRVLRAPTRRRPRDGNPDPDQGVHVRCSAGAVTPMPARPAASLLFRGGAGEGHAVIEGQPASRRVRVEWNGRDERGAFRATSSPSPAADLDLWHVDVLRLDRNSVIARAETHGEVGPNLLWARRGRPVQLVPVGLPLSSWHALPLADGRLLVVADELRWRAAALVDATGAVVTRMRWWAPGLETAELTLVGGQEPAVFARGFRYAIRDDALPVRLEPMMVTGTCRGPTSANAEVWWRPYGVDLERMRTSAFDDPDAAAGSFEVTPSGACLRSIELFPLEGDDHPRGRLAARPDGTLGGTLVGPRGSVAVSCRMEPPP